jgi:hypothetical protein
VLKNYLIDYKVSDDFHYIGQEILGVSANSAWIGDTLTLRAKNLDFRHIPLEGYCNFDILHITKRWQDSMSFIINGSFDASEFLVKIQMATKNNELNYYSFYTVFEKTLTKRLPLLVSTGKAGYAYQEPIFPQAKGVQLQNPSCGVIIQSAGGGSKFTYRMTEPLLVDVPLVPGEYTMQVYAGANHLSNTLPFAVKAPVPESLSPIPFNRNTALEVRGKYLPYSCDYLFTHLESGRKIYHRDWHLDTSNPGQQQLIPEELLGSGTYQAAIEIAGKSYPFPGTVTVTDHFSYLRKMNTPFDTYYSTKPGFALNNKLYVPYGTSKYVVDLATGSVSLKSGYYNFNGLPVFFNNTVYMTFYNYSTEDFALYRFNESVGEFTELSNTGLLVGKIRPAIGVYNNQLIAIASGSIFQYNDKWSLLSTLKNPGNFSIRADQILSRNGNLYLFDMTFGTVTVIETASWTVLRQIRMPSAYESYRFYLFEQNGQMVYYAIPKGIFANYLAYRLNDSTEGFEALDPKQLKWVDDYSFCPDGKGNIYLIDNQYIYQYKP